MGTIQIDGSTPKLTIGNATAEDATILFDGNAQDFYIALDDSADDLLIGLGSTVGTTPAISINEDRDVTISDGAIDFDVASHDGTNGLKLGGTLVTTTAAEMNLLDGGTSVGSSITLADADGIIVNDGGTMKTIPASDISTYTGGGKILQVVNTETGAVATGTTVMPFNDTIPQNDEGVEFMTLAITPTSSSNKLKIDVVIQLGGSTSNRIFTVGLFQDTTANSIKTSASTESIADSPVTMSFQHFMTAGTTSSTTFKVRAGLDGAATITLNGTAGNRKYGDVSASSITIMEIEV